MKSVDGEALVSPRPDGHKKVQLLNNRLKERVAQEQVKSARGNVARPSAAQQGGAGE